MRNLKINKRKYIGLNYLGETDKTDESGYKTGEKVVFYGGEIEFEAHISGATGSVILDNNGIVIEYDKSMVLTKDQLSECGFNENTVFFIDKEPEYDSDSQPLYDYKIKRIKDTINEVMILLEKVRNK